MQWTGDVVFDSVSGSCPQVDNFDVLLIKCTLLNSYMVNRGSMEVPDKEDIQNALGRVGKLPWTSWETLLSSATTVFYLLVLNMNPLQTLTFTQKPKSCTAQRYLLYVDSRVSTEWKEQLAGVSAGYDAESAVKAVCGDEYNCEEALFITQRHSI